MISRKEQISKAFEDLEPQVGRCDECGYFPMYTLEEVWIKACEWADKNPQPSLHTSACKAKIISLQSQLKICVEALEQYADKNDWATIVSCGNIFDELEGDFVMAFNLGEDTPWSKAKEALSKLSTESRGEK